MSEERGGLGCEGLAELLALLGDPSPARHVRIVLHMHHKRGMPFEQAWGTAMRTLSRTAPDSAEWRASFHASKETWRRAYDALSVPDSEPVHLIA